jgi:hypothetical protein
MNRIEWIMSKNPNAESSIDFYEYYDEYCNTFSRISNETYKRYAREAWSRLMDTEDDDKIKTVIKDGNMTVSMKASEIKTEEDLATYGKIDLQKWECTKLTNEFWGSDTNPNYLIKGEYKLRTPGQVTPQEYADAFAELVSSIEPPVPFTEPPKRNKGYLYEISLYDHHFGQIAWESETKDMDYNLEISKKMYIDAMSDFIERSKHDSEKYVLVLGQDFFNVDSHMNTTTKGTPQNEASTYRHTFLEAEKLLVSQINRLALIAPVSVVIVPGNHDYYRMFYMGEFIKAFYKNNPYVTVDNTLTDVKGIKYGASLIGTAHGAGVVPSLIPLLLMQEYPKEYAETKYHELHLGHLHSKSEDRYRLSKSSNGLHILRIPSLVPLDNWHKEKGYRHVKESLMMKWDYTKGKVATFYHHPE